MEHVDDSASTSGGPDFDADEDVREVIDRAVLSETEEGRVISAQFIACFGEFMTGTVRPVLRQVSAAGGEPQLLVNGLAEMLRQVADSVEMPVGSRSPRPVVDQADPAGS